MIDLAALKLVTAAKEKTITELNAKIADQDTKIGTTNDEIDTKKTDKAAKEQDLQGKLRRILRWMNQTFGVIFNYLKWNSSWGNMIEN